MTASIPPTPALHRTSPLRAAGYSYDDVRHLLRRGALTPVRGGMYVAGEWPDKQHARHRLAIRAAVRELGADAVVSHTAGPARPSPVINQDLRAVFGVLQQP